MRLGEMNDSGNKQFNILCLSGGGFRGLYTAKVLAEIEESLQAPAALPFGLIAGTSIGGIIAIAIALHISASHIFQPHTLLKNLSCMEKKYFPTSLEKADLENRVAY